MKWQEVSIEGLGLLRGGRRGPTGLGTPAQLPEEGCRAQGAPGAVLMRPRPQGAGGVGSGTPWMSASLATQGPRPPTAQQCCFRPSAVTTVGHKAVLPTPRAGAGAPGCV